VDDLARGLVFLMERYDGRPHINVGTGVDCTVTELAELIAEVVGYQGRFVYDASKPDGTPRKCSDVSRMRKLGFEPRIGLKEGIAETYRWYLDNVANAV
jgi:GDP-L-fucose synthase